MKRNYWFVRQMHQFGVDDVVYKVAVGSSMRECAKLELVKQYCKDCGMYLHVVDDDSDKAIELLANSLFPDSSFSMLYIRRANVSISELYVMIVDDSFKVFEDALTFTHAHALLLSILSPSSYYAQAHNQCNTICQPYRRQYLSHTDSTEIQGVLIKCGLILGLFLLSGWLEHQEALTFSF